MSARFLGVVRRIWIPALVLGLAGTASAGRIDTSMLEHGWPHETVRKFEVGRYPVRWRQRVSRAEGVLTGVRFDAPVDRQTAWGLAKDYAVLWEMTRAVKAVRYLERTPGRDVIELDMKILWKKLTLRFELEQTPPAEIRFQLLHSKLAQYRGLCRFEERASPGGPVATPTEISTWIKPSRAVPLGLLLIVERALMLEGAKHFLKECERHHQPALASSR